MERPTRTCGPYQGAGIRFSALLKDRHSERSEESAWVRAGLELQILRCAQDDSHFISKGGPQAYGKCSTTP